MNYEQAKEKINEGNHITAQRWALCKILRKATEADVDYINFPPEGLIVESCENRNCDCKIAIHNPTEEDLESDDYVIIV